MGPSNSRVFDGCRGAIAGWLLLAVASAMAADPDQAKYAERLLSERGLVRDGSWFLTEEESRLRQQLDRLRALEKAFQEAAQAAARSRAEVDALREQFEQAIREHEELGKQLASSTLGTRQYNQVVRELNVRTDLLNRLRPMFANPDAIWDQADLRSATRRWSAAQTEFWAALLYIRAHALQVADGYGPYREDSEVTEALAATGGRFKLGPAREYERDLKRLTRAEKLVATDALPTYREEGLQRVGGVLNDQTPVVWAITPADDHSVVPDELLISSGIAVTDDAPSVTLEVGKGRKIPARLITVPKFRVGGQLFEGVSVIAVPRDGHDLGCRLGRKALAAWQLELDPGEQTLRLVPRDPNRPSS